MPKTAFEGSILSNSKIGDFSKNDLKKGQKLKNFGDFSRIH